jgi:hypothetical protein
VEVHLAARVANHVHNPLAAAAGSLPQMQRGRLIAGDEVSELVWQPLDADWVSLEEDDELEQHLSLHFLQVRQ